ncbi:MAG: family 78 glycoside hydrolase catalytic domain [Lachnospiraceae bacterium]|nr:family 78 glycoside hydrolase catalytic domain [Lachnospiraceae bacterium]
MKLKRWLFGILFLAALFPLGAGAAGAAPEKPENLKINLLEDPMGVPREDLRFSWSFVDRDYDEYQSAYRIVIASRASKLSTGPDVADTGWISGGGSAGIRIAGLSAKLEDDQLYYWCVQTKDRDGLESALSTPQAFTTATGTRWASVQGIWGKDAFVFLRGNFQAGSGIEKAVASVTASSPEKSRQYVYDFYVNGELVGLGPSRLNGGKLYYNTYDITDYLKTGGNTAGAICYAEENRSFLCQITVFYTDGRREVLVNSGRDRGSWKALNANQVFGNNGVNVGVGAYYYAAAQNMNGALYPYGWSETSYSAGGWSGASSAQALNLTGTLTPYPSENMTRYEIPSASVKRLSGNSYLVDMGKEIVGSLKLTVSSPVQGQVTVSYGEELNSDGTVRYQMRTGNVYREVWNLKAGRQELGDVGMKTFRYVQIDNCPVALKTGMVQGMAVRQEFSSGESSFSSSNDVLNDIYGMTKYTIQATNQDLYVDSQSRERAAYEGDVLINMLSSYSFEDDYSLARHSLDYTSNNPQWPAEYQLFCIMGAWQDYLYTGDAAFLEKNYDLLKGKLYDSYFDASLGLVKRPKKTLLIDWPYTERDGYDESVFYNTVFNAVCVGAYEDMASIAEKLGKTSDASLYRSRAAVIRDSMIRRLYRRETGTFCDGLTADGQITGHGAQHATAYALAYDIYGDQAMADAMAASIERDGQVTMSVYGTFFLLQGLYESNNGTLARQIMSNPNVNEGVRSWAYMMYELDATVTTEAWNPENKGNMTYSHPWGSAPASQLARGMFGIKPLTGGFDEFQIKLQPGGVRFGSIAVPSVKGSIRVSYEMLGDGRLKTVMTIPANTRARVYLPTNIPANTSLTVNGTRRESQYVNGYFYLELGSGTYEVISDSGIYEDRSELWTNASLSYCGYVTGKGWQSFVAGGETAGTTNMQLSLQALRLQLDTAGMTGGIRIDAHMAGIGWMGWKDGASGNGIPGGGRDLQAVRIELTGEAANQYDIYYRVHSQSYGWLGWAKNGEEAGTVGLSKRAEAVQVKLVAKGFVPEGTGEGVACHWLPPTVTYTPHMQSYGWLPSVADGAVGGVTGEGKRMEAIQIRASSPYVAGGIRYRTYLQTYGWQGWVYDGGTGGTVGEGKRMEAIQIELTGDLAKKYDIYYRVHAQSFGWMGWAKNGESAGTAEVAKRIEAIQIVMVQKGGNPPGSGAGAFYWPNGVFYETHVQTYGWQAAKENGQTSGTEGEAKRLEGIRISLKNTGIPGDVQYRTYVQTYGWLDWVQNGEESGTTGQAKRLEAIEIRLSGKMAEVYDIYYRVHAQSYGWLGWAKNGETAGTMGQAKRLEAIEIRLVPKGTVVEGSGNSYLSSGPVTEEPPSGTEESGTEREAFGTEKPEAEMPAERKPEEGMSGEKPFETETPGAETFGGETPGTEEHGAETSGEKMPETEAPGTEAPEEGKSETEAPGTETPGVGSPEERRPEGETSGEELSEPEADGPEKGGGNREVLH